MNHQLPGRRRAPASSGAGGGLLATNRVEGPTGGGRYLRYRPPLASLQAVGSKTCGRDRAWVAVADSVVLVSAAASDADAPGPGMQQRSGAGDEARA